MSKEKTSIVESISSYALYFGAFDRMMERRVNRYNAELMEAASDENGDLSLERLEELCKEPDRAKDYAHNLREIYRKELAAECFEMSKPLIASREPRLRSAILPYIEEALAAAMGAGLTPHIWAVASDNGLSDGLYLSDGRWRYEALQDLSEEDIKAMEKTAEDIYTLTLRLLGDRNVERTTEAVTKVIKFDLFPLEGGKMAVDSLVTEKNFEDYPSKTEGDLVFFLPFVVSRIDEAIYYAFAYSGEEYLQYIATLSVEKDWDRVNGEKYGLYKNIKERS